MEEKDERCQREEQKRRKREQRIERHMNSLIGGREEWVGQRMDRWMRSASMVRGGSLSIRTC